MDTFEAQGLNKGCGPCFFILLVERLTKKPHARRVRIEVASCVVIRKPP